MLHDLSSTQKALWINRAQIPRFHLLILTWKYIPHISVTAALVTETMGRSTAKAKVSLFSLKVECRSLALKWHPLEYSCCESWQEVLLVPHQVSLLIYEDSQFILNITQFLSLMNYLAFCVSIFTIFVFYPRILLGYIKIQYSRVGSSACTCPIWNSPCDSRTGWVKRTTTFWFHDYMDIQSPSALEGVQPRSVCVEAWPEILGWSCSHNGWALGNWSYTSGFHSKHILSE